MRKKTSAQKLVFLFVLLLALPASAADYKQWIPLLPSTLDGLPRSGQPNGVNMEMGANSWSSLEQEYSKQSRTVKLVIVSGTAAPQTQMFQGLTKLEMETADEIVQTIKIKGYQSVLSLNKKQNQGSVMIGLTPHTLIIVEANQVADQSELTGVANQVPLEQIAAAVD